MNFLTLASGRRPFVPVARLLILVLVLGIAASCASTSEEDIAPAEMSGQELSGGDSLGSEDYDEEFGVNDPLEGLNRAILEFNRTLDGVLFRPLAELYVLAVPEWGRRRVTNALNNLGEPLNFANNLLQGEMAGVASSFMRFAFNSTFGLAGTFDIATELGMERADEDFGQTLAVWGVPEGPYLVLPLFGPSNPRDATGLVVDSLMDPFSYILETEESIARAVTRGIDRRAENLETLDALEETSIDFYAALRELYRQYRDNAIRNGELNNDVDFPSIDIPDYDDEEFGELGQGSEANG